MKKYSLAPYMILSLAALSPQAYSAWEQTVAPYDLDTSKSACIARSYSESPSKKNKNTFTLVFPKDKKSMPLIKMYNENYWGEYIGGAITIGGTKTRGFIIPQPKRRQMIYFMPKSPAEFAKVIRGIKAKNSMRALLYFQKKNKVVANAADFSLSGSTKAVNAIQRCLGGSTLLSSTQKALIEVLQKYSKTSANNIGLGNKEHEAQGQAALAALKALSAEGGSFKLAADKIKAIKANPRYKEVLNLHSKFTSQQSTQGQILNTLNDNQSFYDQSEEIISNIVQTIDTLEKKLASLQTQKEANANTITAAEEKIAPVQRQLDVAQQEYNVALATLQSAESQLSNAKANLSSINSEISSQNDRLNSLTSQRRYLDNAIDTARDRYNNRHQIAREIENEIYQRHGGTPRQINEAIRNRNNKLVSAEAIKQKSEILADQTDKIFAEVSRVQHLTTIIKSTKAEIACYEGDASQQISCLDKEKTSLAANITKLGEDLRREQSNRCRRLFGKNRCRRQRDARIAQINKKIPQVQAKIDAITARIDAINQTGQDPQKDANLTRLKQQLEQKKAERKTALETSRTLINNMRVPGREQFTKARELKNCTPKAKNSCVEAARAASLAMNKLEAQSANDIERHSKKITELEESLDAIDRALANEVDTLPERLRRELAQARRNYNNNEANITATSDNLFDLGESKEAALEDLAAKQTVVDAENIHFSAKSQNLSAKKAALRNLKESLNYRFLLDQRVQIARDITKTNRSLTAENNSLTANTQRRDQIAAEVHTYPERIETASDLLEEAQQVLADIAPDYKQLTTELAQAQREFNRLENRMTPQLKKFSKHVNTTFSRY